MESTAASAAGGPVERHTIVGGTPGVLTVDGQYYAVTRHKPGNPGKKADWNLKDWGEFVAKVYKRMHHDEGHSHEVLTMPTDREPRSVTWDRKIFGGDKKAAAISCMTDAEKDTVERSTAIDGKHTVLGPTIGELIVDGERYAVTRKAPGTSREEVAWTPEDWNEFVGKVHKRMHHKKSGYGLLTMPAGKKHDEIRIIRWAESPITRTETKEAIIRPV